jgi:hypothetical protein
VLFLNDLDIPKAHKGYTNRKSDLRDNVKNGLNVNSLSPPLMESYYYYITPVPFVN